MRNSITMTNVGLVGLISDVHKWVNDNSDMFEFDAYGNFDVTVGPFVSAGNSKWTCEITWKLSESCEVFAGKSEEEALANLVKFLNENQPLEIISIEWSPSLCTYRYELKYRRA
jgi:hypothetical protein